VAALLAEVPRRDVPRPVALIVPHAGYCYSGPVAASGYAQLRAWGTSIPRVVLLGPSHFVPVSTLVLPTADVLCTPLGDVPVDPTGLDGKAVRLSGPHAREHSLEVQLPFLQHLLAPGWAVVPLLVGTATPANQIADCLDAAAADDALVVVSSDLSHYHDHATAQQVDRATADAILARDPARIGDRDACGASAIRGALAWAIRHQHAVSLLDLRTSADTADYHEQVVGYGAFAITPNRSP
jgi:AmmeMemoRadiSam system protein B